MKIKLSFSSNARSRWPVKSQYIAFSLTNKNKSKQFILQNVFDLPWKIVGFELFFETNCFLVAGKKCTLLLWSLKMAFLHSVVPFASKIFVKTFQFFFLQFIQNFDFHMKSVRLFTFFVFFCEIIFSEIILVKKFSSRRKEPNRHVCMFSRKNCDFWRKHKLYFLSSCYQKNLSFSHSTLLQEVNT